MYKVRLLILWNENKDSPQCDYFCCSVHWELGRVQTPLTRVIQCRFWPLQIALAAHISPFGCRKIPWKVKKNKFQVLVMIRKFWRLFSTCLSLLTLLRRLSKKKKAWGRFWKTRFHQGLTYLGKFWIKILNRKLYPSKFEFSRQNDAEYLNHKVRKTQNSKSRFL